MRTPAVCTLVLILLTAAACAPKAIVVPVVTAPKFPEFARPEVPAALAGSDAALMHDRAWRFLQAGDFRSAERDLAVALRATPAFYPAETASGYVALAQADAKAALTHFDRALARQFDYTSALVGKGQALLALNRESEAIAAFEAALAVNPTLVDLRRRVEVLRFRNAERGLAAARQAARDGRPDEAIRAYTAAIASSPESAFLYRELAAVERQTGDADGALTHFRKAVELDPGDASSHAQVGELLEARGDSGGALAAYGASLALEANATVEGKRDALVARGEFLKLPESYRAIEAAPQVTRGDLAALIGVRLGPLLQTMPMRDASVITDVRTHWAEPWIMAVARAGAMEPYDNHTFQPGSVVRRIDLAQALSPMLARAASPVLLQQWQGARVNLSDLAPDHLAFPAASLAAASGVLTISPDGQFQPSRIVTGQEAVEAIQRLAAIAGLTVRR
jgi:tetratricopeptide (TPR) repeat protein